MSDHSVDVSVVIVSYNTREMLRDCVASIFEQTKQSSVEVIVVDNASSDGSCAMMNERFPHQAKLIENSANAGFAAANNQGIKIASGRHVLLLNSDTIILEGAIDKAVQYADQHEDVGIVGAGVLAEREHQSTVFRFPRISHLVLDALKLPALMPESPLVNHCRYGAMNWDEEQDVEAVAGCFLMIRRELIDRIGPLDEDFFMYGEEAEWCFRAKSTGAKVVYYPQAKIIHYWGGSAKKASLNTQLAKRRGQLLFLYKTRGRLAAWTANLVMFLGLLPRVPFWLITELWRKRKAHGDVGAILKYHFTRLMRPSLV